MDSPPAHAMGGKCPFTFGGKRFRWAPWTAERGRRVDNRQLKIRPCPWAGSAHWAAFLPICFFDGRVVPTSNSADEIHHSDHRTILNETMLLAMTAREAQNHRGIFFGAAAAAAAPNAKYMSRERHRSGLHGSLSTLR